MLKKGLMKLVTKLLRDTANKIDADTCEISEEQALDICSTLAHVPLSKEESCSYLNIRRSKFDELIREGKLPKGLKRRGFKELIWYKDELILT